MAGATYTEAQLLAQYQANVTKEAQIVARRAMGAPDPTDDADLQTVRAGMAAYRGYLQLKGLSDPTPQAAQKILTLHAQIVALANAFGVQLPGDS